MVLNEAFRTALREISVHKTRSALSFSAIAVGAASILYTFAQTHGMRLAARQAVELQGQGRVLVEYKNGYVSKGLSPGLTLEDAEEIRRSMPELYMVYPKLFNHGRSQLFYRGIHVENFQIIGVSPDWRKRDWVFTFRGRFLSNWDMGNAARVCLITEPGGWHEKPFWAAAWKESPFDAFVRHHDLLGKHIRINDHDFLVVGVLKQPPHDLDPRWFTPVQPQVLLPVTTMLQYFPRNSEMGKSSRGIDVIHIDTGDEKTMASAKQRIQKILKSRHRGEEDFFIYDGREEIQQGLAQMKRSLLAVTLLGAVALFAGGIGIMNVTLAAMFLRVKEIGIRRAIGASPLDILFQFLLEAGLLGLAGGIVGICLGRIGLAYLTVSAQRDVASAAWYHYTGVAAICAAAACLFSLYPAWQAANLDPVEALRSE